jgi:hypothetical protein
MKMFFARSRHNHHLSPFLFVFVGPTSAAASRTLVVFGAQPLWAFKLFKKKGKLVQVFGDVEWMLTQSV